MKATYTAALVAVLVASALGHKPVNCPAENNADVTLIPNPKSCSTFYICNSGIPYLMFCPVGLHFNPRERVCDLPEHAECVSGGSVPSQPPEVSTPPPPPRTSTPPTAPGNSSRPLPPQGTSTPPPAPGSSTAPPPSQETSAPPPVPGSSTAPPPQEISTTPYPY